MLPTTATNPMMTTKRYPVFCGSPSPVDPSGVGLHQGDVGGDVFEAAVHLSIGGRKKNWRGCPLSEQSVESSPSAHSMGEWQAVSDRLVSGICHDLAGRAAALGGILHLMRLEEEDDESLRPFFDEEISRLEQAIRLLRLLPGNLESAPEPVVPGDHIASLCALHRHHRGLEDVQVSLEDDRSTPPIFVNLARFRQTFLILLADSSKRALDAGRSLVRVSTRPEGGRSVIGFEIPTRSVGDPARRPHWRASSASAVERAGQALAEAGAEVVAEHDEMGIRVEMRFPAMRSAPHRS